MSVKSYPINAKQECNKIYSESFNLSGPRPNTLADHWMLIWQENVTVIVMLTNLTEGTKVHADHYFFSILLFFIHFIKKCNSFTDYEFQMLKANSMYIAF